MCENLLNFFDNDIICFMRKLIVATGNKGKLKEISELLKDKYEVISMKEAGFSGEIEENGKSFYENALIKAKAVSKALGVDALADDSGLCVEALNGEPGIYSARYSGVHGNDKENNALLLKNLEGNENRKAKFRCVVVMYRTDGTVVSGFGETDGTIGFESHGEKGFGYDPIFRSDDLNKFFGEASEDEKNSCSHRFRALKDLSGKL